MKKSFLVTSLFVLLPLPLFAQGASVGGVVYLDADRNSRSEGEAGIRGARVFLDLNRNGIWDGKEPFDDTDGKGNFVIENLSRGTYELWVDERSLPDRMVGIEQFPFVLNLAGSESYTGLAFAVRGENPVIGVAKDEMHIGRQITLTFYLENFGNVTLSNLSLIEDLDAAFGAGNYIFIQPPNFVVNPGGIVLNGGFDGSADTEIIQSGTLAVGATAVIDLTVEITTIADLGMGLGNYSNQVTASGEGPSMGMTSDLSDDGTDPDPNGNGDPTEMGEDDPTIIALLERPVVGVAKFATLSGTQVTYDYYLENLGNVALSNLSLSDDLDAAFGAGNYTVISPPTLIDDPGTITENAGFDGSGDTEMIASGTLALADTAQIRIVVDITTVSDVGFGFGVYLNQATASGTSPGGVPYADISDNGTDPDPNGDTNPNQPDENNPTLVVIGEEPSIGVAKTATVNGSSVTFDFYLESFGNVTLSDLTLAEDLNAVLGATTFFVSSAPVLLDDPGTLTLNAGYDGNFDTDLLVSASSGLASGDTAHIQFQVTVIQIVDLGLGLGNYENQVTVYAQAPGGGLAEDRSDDGTEPDPNGNGDPTEAGENDPTPFTIPPLARLGIAKEYVSGGVIGVDPVVILRFRLENLGNRDISAISISDNLNAVYGAGNFSHLTDPERVTGAVTLNYNAAFNGNTNTSLLAAGSTLAPGDFVVFRIASRITNITDQGFGLGIYQNQVTVNGLDPMANPVSDLSHEGNDPDPDGNGDPSEMDPTVIDVNSLSSIGVAKDVSQAGNIITFDIYLENLGSVGLSSIGMTDSLEALFGAGNFFISVPPFFVVDPGTLNLDPAYDGTNANQELLIPASSSLAAAATAQIQMEVTVTQVADIQGLGLGNYANQVSANAFSALGELVDDLSDFGTDPDPDGDGVGNEGGENDPTTFSIAVNPVGIAKQAMIAGFFVTIDLYIENLGAATVTNVSLIEDLDATFGAGNYAISTPPSFIVDPGTLVLNGAYDGGSDADILTAASTLNAGATAQIQLVVEVVNESDQGNGFGIYSNQATVTATQTGGLIVSDASDDGTDPDPNGNDNPGEVGENDPTLIVITGNPAIGLSKRAYIVGTLVTFDFYIENLGDVTLSNVMVDDPLNPVFGSGNYSINNQPFLVSGPGTLIPSPQYFGFNIFSRVVLGGFLRPGEVSLIRTRININTVTDVGNGFGIYFNSATVQASDPGGTLHTDTSDEGSVTDPDGDGNADEAGENDPTQIIVGDEAIPGVAKTASVNGLQVTFDYYLENFGASTLNPLSLIEDLDSVFGAGNYSVNGVPTFIMDPGTMTLNAGFDGSGDPELISAGTLPGLATARIRLVVDVTNVVDQGLGFGNYSNQVSFEGSAPLGSTCADVSDNGTDPDPNGDGYPNSAGEEDPTPFTLGTKIIGVAKNATVNGNLVTFDYYVENLGTTGITAVTLDEDLDAVFGAGNYTLVGGPVIVTTPRLFVVNPNFDGSSDTSLLASGGMNLGVTEQIQIVVEVHTLIDAGSGLGVYSNQVTVFGDAVSDLSDAGTNPDPNGNGNASEAGENDPTTFTIAEDPTIGAAKTASVTGRSVTVDLYLESFSNVLSSNLSLVEDLDALFGVGNYTVTSAPALIVDPGTLVLDGAFDGGTNPDILTAASTLVIGATAQIRFTILVTTVTNQGFGLGIYQNQVTMSAESPGGTMASDLSDNGTDPDPNGNENPDEAGENDATPIALEGDIGDFVWNDLDGDGMQDGGEPGLAGVTVFLDGNGNTMLDGGEPFEVTDGAGAYDFINLAAGSYTVAVDATTIPAFFNLTTGNLPLVVNLLAGEDYDDADFGYQQQNSSIGDFVWNDFDGDGMQDGGEPGLANITVFLDSNGNTVLDGGEPNQMTDALGAYDFTGLGAGSYTVAIDAATVPAGFVLTTANLPMVVNLAAGEDFNDADFGYQQQDATIGDFVWNDLDGDGIQDGGEPGLAGVTVFLDANGNDILDGGEPSQPTDGLGAYDFTGLPTGMYTVAIDAATVPVGFVLTTANLPFVVNLAAGEDFNDADFGYQQQDASIGDFVWNDLNGDGIQDGGEPGLANVTVFLDLNTNDMFDGGEPSDVTDAGGAYDIVDLPTGNYSVNVDAASVPAGYVLSTANLPFVVNLAAGEDFNDADFGYQRQDGTIGDFVWNDLNGDGIQDGGEPGFDNVTLDLIADLNGNGAIDGGEPVIDTQTTAGGGLYDFANLAVGDYIVDVTDTNGVLTAYVLTGGTDPHPVSLIKGGDTNDADFGYQRQDGTIGDFVWNDLNGDGIQDGGEPGFDNVTLDLIADLNGNGAIDGGEPVLDTQTTAGGGAYDFANLAVGDYLVDVTDTNGVLTAYVLTGGTDPRPVSLIKGGDTNDADFGYQRQDGTIGDFVWNDLNGDGIQDGGEPGFDNVTLDLIADLNGNGAIDGGEPVIDTQTTAGGGLYDFANLAVGDYLVDVTDTNGVLTAYGLTGGTDPHPVSLIKGGDTNDADFGYQRQDGSIGDFVWSDADADNLFDAGELPLGNVTVDLIADLNGNGMLDGGEPVLATQTTDAAGFYDFTGLTLGNYLVDVTDTNGVLVDFVFTGPADPIAVALVKGEDFNDADFGYLDTRGLLGAAKDASLNEMTITYVFTVENFGAVTLTNLSMIEDLDAVFAGSVYQLVGPPVVSGGNAAGAFANPTFDGSADQELFAAGSSLGPGELVQLTIMVEVLALPDPLTVIPTYTNQVTVTAEVFDGTQVSDLSQNGTDPDNDNDGDPDDDSEPTVIVLPLPIPTLGTWGLIVLIAGLAFLAIIHRRRNRLQTG